MWLRVQLTQFERYRNLKGKQHKLTFFKVEAFTIRTFMLTVVFPAALGVYALKFLNLKTLNLRLNFVLQSLIPYYDFFVTDNPATSIRKF